MSNFRFIGSEGSGYYSSSYRCEGVFIDEHIYLKHKDIFDYIFKGHGFSEIDGKHSYTEGSQLNIEIQSEHHALKLFTDVDTDTDVGLDCFADRLYEYIDGEEFTEEMCKAIIKSVEDTHTYLKDRRNEYENVYFYLSKEDAQLVKDFVAQLG